MFVLHMNQRCCDCGGFTANSLPFLLPRYLTAPTFRRCSGRAAAIPPFADIRFCFGGAGRNALSLPERGCVCLLLPVSSNVHG